MNDREIRLLLIEDNPGDQKLASILLAKAKGVSFRVETCERLAAGLERLAQGGFDVLLLDLFLPDSHGLETFDRVHSASPSLPVVVMSTLDDEKIALQALEKGAQDYLIKGQVDGAFLSRALVFAIERQKKVLEAPPGTKGKVLVFVGAKGGVGTTTVALNIAFGIAAAKKKVIAVELRPTFGTFSLHLGHSPTVNLSSVLTLAAEQINESEVGSRLIEFPSGLKVLFGPQTPKDFREIDAGKVEALLDSLAKMAEYVVVELPDATSASSQVAIREGKLCALIIDNDPMSLACGILVLEELRAAGASPPLVKTIVVRRSEAVLGSRIDEIGAVLACPVFGVVTPAADLCLRAQKAGTPFIVLYPNSTASGAALAMVNQLLALDEFKAGV